MALGRLHPSDEYDIRIAVEEGEGGSLDGKWIAMLVDEIEHYSGENTRLTALLAERDAEIARLVELGERMRLAAMYYAANGGDVLCIEFHAACEAWRAALAARGGAS